MGVQTGNLGEQAAHLAPATIGQPIPGQWGTCLQLILRYCLEETWVATLQADDEDGYGRWAAVADNAAPECKSKY